MNRKGMWIAGGLALVVLLAGAAFVAGRMLGSRGQAEGLPEGASLSVGGGGPGEVAGPGGAAFSVQIESSDELPKRPPEVAGLFSRREDNRIFVSSGGQGVMIVAEGGAVEGGSVQSSGPASAGPTEEKEVVVTAETVVLEDVTALSFGEGIPSGGTIRQKLEPGTVDEITGECMVLAWGEKRGDRLVAEVLVYSAPMVIKR